MINTGNKKSEKPNILIMPFKARHFPCQVILKVRRLQIGEYFKIKIQRTFLFFV